MVRSYITHLIGGRKIRIESMRTGDKRSERLLVDGEPIGTIWSRCWEVEVRAETADGAMRIVDYSKATAFTNLREWLVQQHKETVK